MEKFKNWLLPDEEDREAERNAHVLAELGLHISFIGIAIYNIVKGKDNRPLLIVILGSLAGKGMGRFLETRDKMGLLTGVLNLISCVMYMASYVLENTENEGEE